MVFTVNGETLGNVRRVERFAEIRKRNIMNRGLVLRLCGASGHLFSVCVTSL